MTGNYNFTENFRNKLIASPARSIQHEHPDTKVFACTQKKDAKMFRKDVCYGQKNKAEKNGFEHLVHHNFY